MDPRGWEFSCPFQMFLQMTRGKPFSMTQAKSWIRVHDCSSVRQSKIASLYLF